MRALICLIACWWCGASSAQYVLRGTVTDNETGEPIPGASVVLKGTTTGVATDFDGKFELTVSELPPYTLILSSMGYTATEVVVKGLDQELKFKLGADQVLLKEAEVFGDRIGEKQKQAPLTVESMDVIAIREAPSGDFYESLGTLKGVDMTAASFGFKVINTRGFNSTSPVRSLQLIDGVDNQSPGLNFSLGNFLGASDLDVMKVDVIAGASTAYYGPGAFNGVIAMTTKSPWAFPGLSASAKGGERGLFEGAVRYAQVLKNKNGEAKWAYKLNAFALRADDWQATNYDPTVNSPTGADNPGRFDAVNIYGDENTTSNNNETRDITARINNPGLGIWLRRGYTESELVDYGTENFKLGAAVHHRLTDSLEVILASNFSTGTTVYQGDNRYRLKDVKFFQHRLELREEGTWFVRGYLTAEDAGDTYDIFTTGLRMQEATGESTRNWNLRYRALYENWIDNTILTPDPDFIGWPDEAAASGLFSTQEEYDAYVADYVNAHLADFQAYHAMVLDSLNRTSSGFVTPFFEPGSARFDSLLADVTSRRFTEGGSKFYDRSKLAHVMGEYRFAGGSLPADLQLVVGGSHRWYLPETGGTILKDTGDVQVRNSEFGLYAGAERPFLERKLKATATVRLDKNENFDAILSPAASLVYVPREDRVWRLSFSSAVRNPTLADQYLYYNVGRALLLGNIEGQFAEGADSLITTASFSNYLNSSTLTSGYNQLEYVHVPSIVPEKAFTIEGGFRGTFWEKFYLDASAYCSWYRDFIGYLIGVDATFGIGSTLQSLQVYRLAANATEVVRTMGANAGLNYYRPRCTYTVNYSFNRLASDNEDPIIPAFNTPENKFNAGVTGHDLRIPFTDRPHLGFGVNWKLVQGYVFEGSPQFTGELPTYDMVDAQVNVLFPKAHTTVKAGVSNLLGLVPLFDAGIPSDERLDRALDNRVLMVFGGPYVGRLAYIQLIYELNRR